MSTALFPAFHPSPQTSPDTSARRYDLDWLRVFAFGLLIFYHLGMFYVTWDWHVKSRYVSALIEPAMSLVNPWRLALLFFISGVALRFAMDKGPLATFLPRRILRLFVPLAFGMAVICMPQAYAELRYRGEIAPGILAFYPRYLGFGNFSIIVPTWNHLWYVAYVLVYTMIAAACMPLLSRVSRDFAPRLLAWLDGGSVWRLLLVPVLPFLVYQFALEPYFPTTHTLWGDWANIANTLTLFLFGWLAAKDVRFWSTVRRAFPTAVRFTLVLVAVAVAALLNMRTITASETLFAGLMVLKVVYAWAAIVTLLGFAQRFANHPGALLTYLTTAIFPYYILHQTLIVVVGYWFTLHAAPLGLEVATILGATLFGCAVGYEIIRRVPVLRPLFGLPFRSRTAPRFPAADPVRREARNGMRRADGTPTKVATPQG